MALIHIYDSISNEHTELHANGKLKDVLAGYNFTHTIAIKEGNRIDPETELTESDVVYVRSVPADATTWAIIAVVCAVAAIGTGIGAAHYAKKQSQEAKEQMEKAQRDADNLAQQISQLPFIRGAKNKSALGNPVQFVMGDIYNTPYLTTDGFYTISGTNGTEIFYNSIFSVGWGKQQINKVMIGDFNLLTNENGITGVNSFDSTSVFYDSNNVIEVAQEGQDFETSYFKQKVLCTLDNTEIKHDYGKNAEPVIKQLADNTQKVEVCIMFNALRQYNQSASAWEACSVNILPEWTNDDGATWHEFSFENLPASYVPMSQAEINYYVSTGELTEYEFIDGKHYSSNSPDIIVLNPSAGESGSGKTPCIKKAGTISANSKSTIRFVASKEFTPAETYGKIISIRLTRTNPKHESNSNEDCYLLYYQSYCFDNAKSSNTNLVPCKCVEDRLLNTVRLGTRIIANDSTEGILDEFHVLSKGCARVFNNNVLSTEKVPTRNPASWILEILTSNTHKHSKYNDSEINLNSFATLYKYCEDNEYYTDGIVTANIKKSELISKILSTVNSDLIVNSDGELEVVIDKAETTPVALINAENIISANYAKSMEITPDGARVSFYNRENWKVDTFSLMLDGEAPDDLDKLTEYNIDFVTTYKHANKFTQRKLREQQLQPYVIKANVGLEGDYYPLYSTILVQMDQFRQGIASSVITGVVSNDGYITDIMISDYVVFDDSSRYGIIIQAQSDNGRKIYSCEVTGSGQTRKLHLKNPITISGIVPAIGNHLSFGYLEQDGSFDKVTKTMKICGISPSSTNGYELELREYNPAVYTFSAIPQYKSNLTSKPQNRKNPTSLEDISKAENAALDAISGRSITMRNLPSLESEGYQNEVATYGGNLYIYLNGNWEPITTAQYLGEYDSLPDNPANGQYFYAADDFIFYKNLYVNNIPLEVNGGTLEIGVSIIKKGYIYVYSNDDWLQVEDKSNFRYMSLFTQNLKRAPRYVGIYDDDPTEEDLIKGDFYTYSGETTAARINGWVYMYNGDELGTWAELDPDVSSNAEYYMRSLSDVLKTSAVESQNIGYFNVVFTNALMSSAAAIDTLQTQTIELQNGGVIKSANYISGSSGFKIDGNSGDVEFGSGTFRGTLGTETKVEKEAPLITGYDDRALLCILYKEIITQTFELPIVERTQEAIFFNFQETDPQMFGSPSKEHYTVIAKNTNITFEIVSGRYGSYLLLGENLIFHDSNYEPDTETRTTNYYLKTINI